MTWSWGRPRGLTSTWWGVTVYVFDITQSSLPQSFLFCCCVKSMSVFVTLSTVFHSINPPDNPPFSLSVLPVLFLPYWTVQLSLWKSPSAFHSGELRTQKLESHLLRTQSLKVLPLNPGTGQYIATHATLTAKDFFLSNCHPFDPFTCIFRKPLPSFSCVGCG